MGILSQLLATSPTPARRSYGELSGVADPKDWLIKIFGGKKTAAGVEVDPDSAMRSTAVFASVRVRAQAFAMLPLNVYKNLPDGGKAVDKKHWAYPLLHDQPNDWQTSYEWREMGEGHDALRGNFYCQKLRSANTLRNGVRPTEQLIPMHPNRVRIERNASGDLVYVYTEPRGSEVRLSRDQVLHVRGLSLDGVYGESPVGIMMNAIGLSIATEEYGSRFFSQRAIPSGFFKHPNVMGPDAIDTFKNEMRDLYEGVDKSHGIAVLEEGMDFVSVGMKNEEAQFLETRKFQLHEVARIFGVPPHMIGDLERATFSNIEQQSIEFVTHCLLPIVRRWEQALTRDLLSPEERKTHSIGFVMEGLLRGDTASRFQAYAIARQWGWMNIDEIREREDMNKLSDGKGEHYLEPLNMRVVGEPQPEPAPQAPPPQLQDMPQDVPADAPKPPDNVRNQPQIDALKPVFEDVLGRILRKEGAFLDKIARKYEKKGDIESLKREIDEFYNDHLVLVPESIRASVRAAEAFGAVVNSATDYANFHVVSSRALTDAALLDQKPFEALLSVAERMKSDVTALGAAEAALRFIVKGERS